MKLLERGFGSLPVRFGLTLVACFSIAGCKLDSTAPAVTSSQAKQNSLSVATATSGQGGLSFEGPSAISIESCQPLTLTLRDSNGNPVSADAPVTLSLGGGSAQFYAAAPCDPSSPVTAITLPAGASQVSVYFLPDSAQSMTLTANSANPSLTATLAITVQLSEPSSSLW